MSYSNCLFEALKAKLKDPKNVYIYLLPPSLNKGRWHFYWVDYKNPDFIQSFIDPKASTSRGQKILFKNGKFDKRKREVFENFTIQRVYNKTHSLKEMLKLAKKLRFQINEVEIKNLYENLEFARVNDF